MSREQAKQNLIGIGIAEPTDEQITNYLNQVNGESQKYKDDASKYQATKQELDTLKAQGLTDQEKQAQALERIAELEKREALTASRNSAMTNFKITAEQASKVVKDDGTYDYETLGQIIAEKETAAATAKEQEIFQNSGNPGGGSGSGSGTEKTSAEKYAEQYGKAISDGAKTAESIVNSYK